MKYPKENAIVSRRSIASLLLVAGVFLLVGFACGKSSESKPIPPAYVGSWTGDDGSTITIRADGSGDYRSGATSVSGGTVEIDEAAKSLSISFVGIGPELTIDKAPSGDLMTLSGVVYLKSGGSRTQTSNKTDDETSSGELPSDREVGVLLKANFADFTDAVEMNDFTDFYAHSSADFKASYTKAETAKTFKTFVDQKERVLPSLTAVQAQTPIFSSPPSIRTEKGIKILTANGEFATSPSTVKFETDYEWDKGDWKILKFKLKL